MPLLLTNICPPHWICRCALSNGAQMTIIRIVQQINTRRTGSSCHQTHIQDVHSPSSNVSHVHLHLNAPNIYMKKAHSTKTNRCRCTQWSEWPLFPWWWLRRLDGSHLMWASSLICRDRVLKDSSNTLQILTGFTFFSYFHLSLFVSPHLWLQSAEAWIIKEGM